MTIALAAHSLGLGFLGSIGSGSIRRASFTRFLFTDSDSDSVTTLFRSFLLFTAFRFAFVRFQHFFSQSLFCFFLVTLSFFSILLVTLSPFRFFRPLVIRLFASFGHSFDFRFFSHSFAFRFFSHSFDFRFFSHSFSSFGHSFAWS